MAEPNSLAQSFPTEVWAALVSCFTLIAALLKHLYNKMNTNIEDHDDQLERGKKEFENLKVKNKGMEGDINHLGEKHEELSRTVEQMNQTLQEMRIDCAKQHGGKP